MTHVRICSNSLEEDRALNARRIKPGDIAVLALIALAAVALLTSRTVASRHPDQGLFVITQSKAGYRRAEPLGSDVTFDVETPSEGRGPGGVNTVAIKDGRVMVTSSNCANQVCVQHDPIDEPGEQIVCLPHGLVIEIARDAEGGTPLS